jgi:hypothetical protein
MYTAKLNELSHKHNVSTVDELVKANKFWMGHAVKLCSKVIEYVSSLEHFVAMCNSCKHSNYLYSTQRKCVAASSEYLIAFFYTNDGKKKPCVGHTILIAMIRQEGKNFRVADCGF